MHELPICELPSWPGKLSYLGKWSISDLFVRLFYCIFNPLEHYAVENKHGELALQTIEEESLFEAAYPEIVAVYQKQKSENKGKKQKSMYHIW